MSSATATVSATWWPTWPPRSKPSQLICRHHTQVSWYPSYTCTIRHCIAMILPNSIKIVDPHLMPEEKKKKSHRANEKDSNWWPITLFVFVEFPVLFLYEMEWRCESFCLSVVLKCCSQWWNKVLCLWDSRRLFFFFFYNFTLNLDLFLNFLNTFIRAPNRPMEKFLQKGQCWYPWMDSF